MRCLKYWSIALLVAAASACADNTTSPSQTTTSVSTTDVFSGTLTPNGAVTHPFSTAASGAVTATLSKVLVADAPDTSLKIGFMLGIWNGAVCQSSASNDAAAQGTALARNVSGAGRLCVRVYDAAGSLTAPIGYEVTVVHP